ncbi:hypothetical protein PFISCL1PPCAC_19504, partial [Pristionchus fissidentatus]
WFLFEMPPTLNPSPAPLESQVKESRVPLAARIVFSANIFVLLWVIVTLLWMFFEHSVDYISISVFTIFFLLNAIQMSFCLIALQDQDATASVIGGGASLVVVVFNMLTLLVSCVYLIFISTLDQENPLFLITIQSLSLVIVSTIVQTATFWVYFYSFFSYLEYVNES